jgi:hypothetical protein
VECVKWVGSDVMLKFEARLVVFENMVLKIEKFAVTLAY